MKIIKTVFGENGCETEETILPPAEDDGAEMNVIDVYPDEERQTLYGFGGAVTEAAGYVYSSLTEEKKKELIDAYFGENGLGYTFGRISIDSCDFGLGNYGAKTNETDRFSLSRDEKYVMPLLRDIYGVRRTRLFAAPWSPPPYMKTNNDKNGGGKLKKEYYAAWAEYMCEYLKAYETAGFDLFAVSVQNEPKAIQPWDSCLYTAEEEGDFLEHYLYPAMKAYGLGNVRRIVWDHNRERVYERLKTIYDRLADKTAVCGVGYHWYAGDHFGNLSLVGEHFPDLLSVFTEGCIEYSGHACGDVSSHGIRYAHEIAGCFNHGCNIFIDWNILLDPTGGPNHKNNFCEAPVMADGNGGLTYLPAYYAIGHFSRFLQSGAKRVVSSKFSDAADVVSWKNPDGTLAIAAFCRDGTERTVTVRFCGKCVVLTLPGKGIVTAVLPEEEYA